MINRKWCDLNRGIRLLMLSLPIVLTIPIVAANAQDRKSSGDRPAVPRGQRGGQRKRRRRRGLRCGRGLPERTPPHRALRGRA